MAKGNGSADLTVRILIDIRDEIRGLARKQDETNQRLGRLEFRFENFLKTAGGEVKSLRERVNLLDRRVVRLESNR